MLLLSFYVVPLSRVEECTTATMHYYCCGLVDRSFRLWGICQVKKAEWF